MRIAAMHVEVQFFMHASSDVAIAEVQLQNGITFPTRALITSGVYLLFMRNGTELSVPFTPGSANNH